mmetsp:Transcript_25527/g.50266  ORF Transcript_25527/g.50266 Transcript_25527/m.50266 type:complete len:344 (-) Transcript_25527:103-1134(-)|eukprot:CAMPEP_0175121378 /NCGR_PEP_ID=MMETSP0087-20121206/1134_1 /TAXON_ID=136419 /ORGANISM="Unknown Unknown, Strain D1" /LENGTH=343 /DNA_ID=CAMNT_0016402911 /DNA_START=26 /DNA_END=1057 /DNA_ORIENTATION=+
MLGFLLLTALSLAATDLQTCPTKTGLGPSACPSNATCCLGEYFGGYGCIFAGTTHCCSPGPPLEPSSTLPNCLIIGDSVSIQYTSTVAKLLKTTCQVQHAPWVGGGSANNAANGLYNLQNCRWLRTALRPDIPVKWDIIQFNFGLHDLTKADPAQPELLDLYEAQLENITQLLLESGAKHVQYALTTPFEADAQPGCGPYCNAPPKTLLESPTPYPQPKNGGNGRCGPPICEAGSLGCGVPNATAKAHSPDPNAPGCGPPTYAVTKLNQRAKGVMAKHSVPMLDLNTLVHSHCGAQYSNCSLCDDETEYMGIRCGYHYSVQGAVLLANAVADSFRKLLNGSQI